jgi:endoglucanase
VTRTGKGGGTVTSTPSGIRCGKVCTKTFVAGTSVVLHAKASKGSRFDHWAGACARFKTAPTCTLKLSRAAGVIAAFAPVRKG